MEALYSDTGGGAEDLGKNVACPTSWHNFQHG
jgi:hypothetical protein